MNNYIYHNNDKGKWEATPTGMCWMAPEVFQCHASSIIEADKLFEQNQGYVAMKKPHISCQIIFDSLPEK